MVGKHAPFWSTPQVIHRYAHLNNWMNGWPCAQLQVDACLPATSGISQERKPQMQSPKHQQSRGEPTWAFLSSVCESGLSTWESILMQGKETFRCFPDVHLKSKVSSAQPSSTKDAHDVIPSSQASRDWVWLVRQSRSSQSLPHFKGLLSLFLPAPFLCHTQKSSRAVALRLPSNSLLSYSPCRENSKFWLVRVILELNLTR